jgi:hypothetical protein
MAKDKSFNAPKSGESLIMPPVTVAIPMPPVQPATETEKGPWLLLTGAGESGSEVLILKDEVYCAESQVRGRTRIWLRDGSMHDVAEPPSKILDLIRNRLGGALVTNAPQG